MIIKTFMIIMTIILIIILYIRLVSREDVAKCENMCALKPTYDKS